MSEKQQRTAQSMREKMLSRYGEECRHKHNKNHTPFRQHCRSHPVQTSNNHVNLESESESTGLLRAFKLRKIRKRLDKGRIH
ncbi:MAG: hypothetical protein LCH30_01240 [Proteobacteria bacterium]|nr:hypothetical protein [Pseudomonadota bacterium]